MNIAPWMANWLMIIISIYEANANSRMRYFFDQMRQKMTAKSMPATPDGGRGRQFAACFLSQTKGMEIRRGRHQNHSHGDKPCKNANSTRLSVQSKVGVGFQQTLRKTAQIDCFSPDPSL